MQNRRVDVLKTMAEGNLNKHVIGVIVLCGILIIFDGYDTALMGLCMTSIKADLQIDSIIGGYLGSASVGGMFFGAIICGILSDRIGRRKVIIASLLFFAIFTGLNAFAYDAHYFFVTRFLTGLGLGGLYPSAFSLASEYAPTGKKAVTVVLVGVGMEIGKIMSVLVALALMPLYGWRIMFAICLLPLLTIPLLIRHLPDSIPVYMKRGDYEKVKETIHKMNASYIPQDDDILIYKNADGSETKAGSFRELFRQGRARNSICFIVLYSSIVFIGYACLTWLPDLLVTHGYSLTMGHLAQLALQTGTLIAALLFGLAADRIGFRRGLIIMYTCGLAALLALSFTLGCGEMVTMAILVGVGAFACDQNLNHAYITASYPINLRGTILGWGLGIARIPGLCAPILLGYLSAANVPLSSIFMILAILPCICLLCSIVSKDTVSKTNIRSEKKPIKTA